MTTNEKIEAPGKIGKKANGRRTTECRIVKTRANLQRIQVSNTPQGNCAWDYFETGRSVAKKKRSTSHDLVNSAYTILASSPIWSQYPTVELLLQTSFWNLSERFESLLYLFICLLSCPSKNISPHFWTLPFLGLFYFLQDCTEELFYGISVPLFDGHLLLHLPLLVE